MLSFLMLESVWFEFVGVLRLQLRTYRLFYYSLTIVMLSFLMESLRCRDSRAHTKIRLFRRYFDADFFVGKTISLVYDDFVGSK